jgi:hypothetical protein
MPIPHGLLGQTFFLVVTLGVAMPLFPNDLQQENHDVQLQVIVPDRETTAILDRVALGHRQFLYRGPVPGAMTQCPLCSTSR